VAGVAHRYRQSKSNAFAHGVKAVLTPQSQGWLAAPLAYRADRGPMFRSRARRSVGERAAGKCSKQGFWTELPESIDALMAVPPPSAAEGTTLAMQHATRVPAAIRAERLWRPNHPSQAWRYSVLRRMLVCADVAAAALASVSLAVASAGDIGQVTWSLAFLPVWVGLAKLLGLYDRDEKPLRHTTIDEGRFLLLWSLSGAASLALLLSVAPAERPDAIRSVVVAAVAAASIFPLRALVRLLWRKATPPERAAIIGSAATIAPVKRKLQLFHELHVTIVQELEELDLAEGRAIDLLQPIDRLVYAPASIDDDRVGQVVQLSRATQSVVSVVPPCPDLFGPTVRQDHLAELPVLEFSSASPSPMTALLKRALDVLLSATALLVLMPLFLLIALAIKVESDGPVLFLQVRAGVRGRPFRMLKFRSMVAEAEDLLHNLVSLDGLPEPMFKLQDDPRVTGVGRILRRWSLDELPQLWNVLVGEMSLVGPRPEQLELVERYEPEHRDRLALKPGITGPMQVYGRGELTFAERLAVERHYIEGVSVVGDLRILAMTIPAALSGRGAY